MFVLKKERKKTLQGFSSSRAISYIPRAQLQHSIHWKFQYQSECSRFNWTAKETNSCVLKKQITSLFNIN